MILKIYNSVAKGLKLKVRQFLELNPTFIEVTAEKLVGGGLFALLNMVKPMLSKKIDPNGKLTLIKSDEIIKTEKGIAKVLNTFFSKYCPKYRHSAI